METHAPSAIARRTQQTQLSHGLTPASSRRIEIQTKLATTCLDRGEALDEVRLDSYSKALTETFPDNADIFAVLDRLANSPRAEFEPIIPAKADLIHMIKAEDWARRRKAREAQERAGAVRYAEIIAAERAAGTYQHLDIGEAMREVKAERKAESQRVCPHCGNQESPSDPAEIRKLGEYYLRRADAVAQRLAVDITEIAIWRRLEG